ncbi:MAG: hypothetical protein ACTHN0_05465 [Aquihabitans sp.]
MIHRRPATDFKEPAVALDAHEAVPGADPERVSLILDDEAETGAPRRGTDAPAPGRAPIAWGEVARWAAMGLLLLVALTAVDVHQRGADNPLALIQPGQEGPSPELFARDFPDDELPNDVGLDGQQYYAIARNPLHLDETASNLDFPRYRYQRPLLPFTAWLLHPSGGGTPLVLALVAVSFAGIAILALASGGLSMALRGPPWVAGLVPLLPGAYWSLRVTVSDGLALGLALAAIVLSARDRRVWAVVVGCLAVLAKEPVILILLGWSISRRTRRDALLTAVPAAVIVAWMACLRLLLPADVDRPQDIGLPLAGLVRAWRDVWAPGRERLAMACIVTGLGLAVAALVLRGLRHPLGWPIAVQLAFLVVMGHNPLGTNFGGTRMALPIAVLSILALATPYGDAALPRVGWRPGPPPAEPGDDPADAVTAPATAPA